MRNLFLALFYFLTFSNLTFAMNFLSEAKEPNFDEGWKIAQRNRLYAPCVWYYEFSKYMNWNDDNTQKLYEAWLSIHHLAGNAKHIWYMYNDAEYRKFIKEIERSYGNNFFNRYGFIENRNSKEDFNDIVDLLTRVENAGKNFDNLYNEVKRLEKDLTPYRIQKKLTYPRNENSYYTEHSIDYDSGPDFD